MVLNCSGVLPNCIIYMYDSNMHRHFCFFLPLLQSVIGLLPVLVLQDGPLRSDFVSVVGTLTCMWGCLSIHIGPTHNDLI